MAQWLNWGKGTSGSPNSISGTINTYATCTGTAGQTSLTTALSASAGDQILIHQSQGTGAGTWEICEVVSDAGATLNLKTALVNSYGTGAQAVLIPQYTGGDISGTVGCTAWNGSTGGIIALLSNGDLTVSGTLDVADDGFRAGTGGSGGNGYQGESPTGVGINTYPTPSNRNPNGAGGGAGHSSDPSGGAGGSYDGTGGAGGYNDASQNPTNPSTGTADYTKAYFGSGGGGGVGSSSSTGNGGKGGGFILIIAKNLTVSGTITASGNQSNPSTSDRPGGGGAGGLVMIKTQVGILGTNKIVSLAGVPGTRINTWNCYPTAGTAGRIRCEYFTSVSGSTNPTLSSAQDLTLNVPASSGFFNFF